MAETNESKTQEALVKEPILMNWIIIFVTLGVMGLGSYLLIGA